MPLYRDVLLETFFISSWLMWCAIPHADPNIYSFIKHFASFNNSWNTSDLHDKFVRQLSQPVRWFLHQICFPA